MTMRPALAAVAVSALFAASAEPGAAGEVVTLGVDFSWAETSGCFAPESPAFTVSNVPKGTEYLRFEMTDLDAPDFEHGGGTVRYSGPEVPRGAFRYKGPCPPSGAHNYRWDVTALDASRSKVLGRGSKALPYSQ